MERNIFDFTIISFGFLKKNWGTRECEKTVEGMEKRRRERSESSAMELKQLGECWDELARQDALWAILTHGDKKGGRWDSAEFFNTGKEEILQVFEYLDSLGLSVKREKALDFGCGVGRLTLALADHFGECSGVDLSFEMISLAKKLSPPEAKCQYIHNPKPHLSLFPDGTFDFIYSNITLQHMKPEYALRYLEEFLRVLKPGGILLFQIPSEKRTTGAKKFKNFFKNLLPSWIREFHKNYRRRKGSLSALMEMHCLKKEKVLAFFENRGCAVVDIVEDDACGKGYRSYRYCVVKGK